MSSIKALGELAKFYLNPIKYFVSTPKEPRAYLEYRSLRIQNFRGIREVEIDFKKNQLILLLGLNESGKTSILKAIESFDFSNDPESVSKLKPYFTSMRNKQDIECNDPTLITAEIAFTKPLPESFFTKLGNAARFSSAEKKAARDLVSRINSEGQVKIRRVIPFSNGNAKPSYYEFFDAPALDNPKNAQHLAQEIVSRAPFIIYFEDFQDSIPEKIYASRRSQAFNETWFDIIDGLFYNTNEEYNVHKFLTYYSKSNPRIDDASTVLNKVNKTLQETFTKKWINLSGVQAIEDAKLTFQPDKKYFEIKVTERDGTTFSVRERSKGAIWYLAFLMKTEFRRKKLRKGKGKPVFLIDEPASNLHSTAQEKMVGDFIQLVEDTTLIYTTHSRYLVSADNIKNTYIIARNDGFIECEKWGSYIQGKEAKVSYYQPLFDCLSIVPNSFDVPWSKALITEGPSDAAFLNLAATAMNRKLDYVIYPGSSATNLDTLIALNLGWSSEFKLLLDSDIEGNTQKDVYMERFGLTDEEFITLPDGVKEIEGLFTVDESERLIELALDKEFSDSKSRKKALFSAARIILLSEEKSSILDSILSSNTKKSFDTLFESITFRNS